MFRVAARPSLDLSLPDAAITQVPLYIATAAIQPVASRFRIHTQETGAALKRSGWIRCRPFNSPPSSVVPKR